LAPSDDHHRQRCLAKARNRQEAWRKILLSFNYNAQTKRNEQRSAQTRRISSELEQQILCIARKTTGVWLTGWRERVGSCLHVNLTAQTGTIQGWTAQVTVTKARTRRRGLAGGIRRIHRGEQALRIKQEQ